MKLYSFKISFLAKKWMIFFLFHFLLNFISGVGLWCFKTHFWRVLHGISVPGLIFALGIVFYEHVLPRWSQRRNLWSGFMLMGSLFLLTVTGWLLYYAGSDHLQNGSRQIHMILGWMLGVILPFHRWSGRRNIIKLDRQKCDEGK